MIRQRLILIWIIFAGLLAFNLPTQAHGYIVRSIPEDRSTLDRAPARLQYWFSEALEPDFSAINLRNDRGEILVSGGLDEQDDTLLTLQVPQDLPEGAYIVELRPAFASDGHVVAESRVFFIGEEVSGIVGEAASDQAIPLEVIWKTVFFNATYVLFGTAMLYTFILVPVWGNPRYPQGLLPPRLMRRLNVIMGGMLLLAAYANVVGLLQQTMAFFGTSLELVLDGSLWNVVRIGSRFGDVWNFRMLVLAMVALMQGASLYYGRRYPKTVRSFWTANTYLLALLLGAQAVNSHAAGSLVMPWNAVLMHWLHSVAVAFWVGGILALALTLPIALAPYQGEARWQALQPIMRRFSRYIVGAVLVVITSGIYSASNWFFSADDFVSSYGAALGYKLAMIALLLFVGALHHIALRPHYLARLPLMTGLVRRAQRFRGTLRLEALIAIAAILLAAFMSSTPVPEPNFLETDIQTPSMNRRVGEYDIQMTIAPAAVGINSVDFAVRRNILLIEDIQLDVQFVLPARDQRSDWFTAEPVDQGLYALVTDAVDRTGNWLALVNIIDADGRLTRVVFDWQVTEDADLLQSIPASWVNILAALATLSALLYVILPALRRLAAQMNWSATNVVISLGLVLMTLIALWASAVYLNQQATAIDAQQHPPPTRINDVLPDMGSIAIGGALITDACPNWSHEDALTLLVARLGSWDDEDLYQITVQGWRDLAPCEATLSQTQRWHIVNYLRSR